MSWSDTTPAPNVKAAAMLRLPRRDPPSLTKSRRSPPTMAAKNKSLAESNKSPTGGKATKKRNSAIGLFRWVQITALCLRSSRHFQC